MENLNKPFLQRSLELEVVGDDGIQGYSEVHIKFWQPYKIDSNLGYGFNAAFQIIGLDDEKIYEAGGEDEVQAILMAMTAASSLLCASEEYKQGRLKWCGTKLLGLPLSGAIIDIVEEVATDEIDSSIKFIIY